MASRLASLLSAALATAVLPSGGVHAATVFATGAFGVDEDTTVVAGISEGPGRYQVTLDLSAAPLGVTGDAIKTSNYNYYCDYQDGNGVFYCGGDDNPVTSQFTAVSPTRYEAFLDVLPFRSTYFSDSLYVREDDFDTCCNVQLDIFSDRTGSYTLSIAAIPEPSSWALMIAGLGAVGAAMRRRGRVAVA